MNLFVTGSAQPKMRRTLLSSTLNGSDENQTHTNAQVLISYLETFMYKVFVLRGSTQSLHLRGKASGINSPRQRPLKLETPSSSTVKTLQRNIQSSSSFPHLVLLQYKVASQLTRSRRCFRQCAGVENHSDSPRAASKSRQSFWLTSSSSIDSMICCHSARHAHLFLCIRTAVVYYSKG